MLRYFRPNPRALRFESTYKELKLHRPLADEFGQFRFESTYKELKPDMKKQKR